MFFVKVIDKSHDSSSNAFILAHLFWKIPRLVRAIFARVMF